MLYNFQRKKLCRHLLVGGALLAAGFGTYSCSDTYDLESEQPSGLNSIYGYMVEQGNYQNYLQLVKDCGMDEILSKTGSKTMFIADDDAFAEFFKNGNNLWGVSKYEELTPTQRRLLLNASMIDNPYSTSMLSTAEGPVKGQVCRRASSLTLYDSVFVWTKADPEKAEILPNNSFYNAKVTTRDTVVLYTDASMAPPMVHFNYKFIASNKLESTDIDFLYGQQPGTRGNDDVYVNRSHVIEPNIFCKNGFIHKVDRVVTPLENMAEIIRKDPDTKIFSSIIERFADAYYTPNITNTYNTVKGANFDSVFVKRYFSDRSAGSSRQESTAYPQTADVDAGYAHNFEAALKFDPGWNGYMPLSGDPRDAMMENMAVMLVPTDEAMNKWWTEGGGKVLQDYYSTLDDVPSSTLADLVNVNMLEELTSSVPSRFADGVLDDSNEPLGLTVDSVAEVIIGCNGIVYKTDKVYAPKSYSSVLFPAVVDTTNFKIIKTAIDLLDYDKYLNSMVSKYIFLIPTNNGLLSYVDPVSYGQSTSQLWEFGFDPTQVKEKRIIATVYNCELNTTTGKWERTGEAITTLKNINATERNGAIRNRLEKLLDDIIVTTGYNPDQKYYLTKGRTHVRVDGVQVGSKVYGAFQAERDFPYEVQKVYTMNNGHALVLDGPIMGSTKSVAMRLSENPEFSTFLEIMQKSGALANANAKDSWTAVASGDGLGNLFNLKNYGDVGAEDKPSTAASSTKATYLLNNYHYTVYAPTNDAMQIAFDMGLPTLQELEAAEAYDTEQQELGLESDSAARIKEAMLDFVKYHIHDNSVFVDGGNTPASYESAKTELIASTTMAENVVAEDTVNYIIKPNTMSENADGTYNFIYYTGKYSPGRPYKLKVDSNAEGMTVTDNIGMKRNVKMEEGMYNIQANEYWITGSFSAASRPYSSLLNNSSSVVIHAIDGPLVYADGKHYDAEGNLVPTQFVYKYKPLTSE